MAVATANAHRVMEEVLYERVYDIQTKDDWHGGERRLHACAGRTSYKKSVWCGMVPGRGVVVCDVWCVVCGRGVSAALRRRADGPQAGPLEKEAA